MLYVGIDVDTYALVGEAVYGWGRAGRGTDGRTNYDRGKGVVPETRGKHHFGVVHTVMQTYTGSRSRVV